MKKTRALSTILMLSGLCAVGEERIVQDLQSKITTHLMEIKRTHPESQRTVYTVLDLTSKLAQTAKTVTAECEDLRKSCKQKNQEIESLKLASRESFKKELDGARQSLETVKAELVKQLESEKSKCAQLEKEKTSLEQKLKGSVDTTTVAKKDATDDLVEELKLAEA